MGRNISIQRVITLRKFYFRRGKYQGGTFIL